ncbi:TetR/AcrR family transcriptional regulator [Nocardia paucivorans]|uniref:TetR/AcrR family transcriptional regulator n=1 Tax=Nocardia paucivorans TaxID=114259 RepID=UPI000593FB15|nr:TetR/AcrR family transcriptional regulator [Nocardia paucivorans]
MTSRQPGRRRTAETTGAARLLILDAAERLFAAQGFDATSTAAIAAAAGVPKGLIFYYFPTKEAILSTLISERVPERPVVDITPLVAPGDPATSLLNLDTALNRDRHGPVLRTIMWREARTHPEIGRRLRGVRDQLLDLTVRVLQASVPTPLRPGTLRAGAAAWVSAMFGLVDWPATPDGRTPANGPEPRRVAQVIAAGMAQLG